MRAAVKAAAQGETVQFEVTCPQCDGYLATLEFSVRPITAKSGRVVFLVAESHDITEKLRAEEEAREHRDRIAHVSRLSTLGEMAAGIAHEINQPLTAISLFAQAASRLVAAGDFEKMVTVSEKLNEHALRASEVVERMQVMARQGEGVREMIACNDLIGSAVRLAESEARIRDIRIIFQAGENVPSVFVDAVQIQQVALNLLRNAMEAMLLVDCCEEKTIEISTRALDENVVEVAVTDCGVGVSKENEGMLFKPFSTTKKSGMGMGLSISQAIVTSHGGRIDFRNNEPRGVTFWFTLPAASGEMQHGR
jgi:two-component system sensor kinase FixL